MLSLNQCLHLLVIIQTKNRSLNLKSHQWLTIAVKFITPVFAVIISITFRIAWIAVSIVTCKSVGWTGTYWCRRIIKSPVQRIGLKILCEERVSILRLCISCIILCWKLTKYDQHYCFVSMLSTCKIILPVQRLGLKMLSEERVSINIAIITWISYFVLEIIPFFIIFKFFLNKNKYNIINFDLTFSIQSSKFKKSVSFGSNLKIKNCEK